MAVLEQLIEGYGRSVPGTPGNGTMHGGLWPFPVPYIDSGNGTVRLHQIELWSAATGLPLHPAATDLCAALGREVPGIQRW